MLGLLVLNNVIWFAFLIFIVLFLTVEIMLVLFSLKWNWFLILLEQFGCTVPWFSCNLTNETPCKVKQQKWALIQFWCHLLQFWVSVNFLYSLLTENKLKRVGSCLWPFITSLLMYECKWCPWANSWTKLPCYFCKTKARILVCNSGGYEHGVS